MASYIFEQMTASDAANFTSTDTLIFASSTATAASFHISYRQQFQSTTVTLMGKSLVFYTAELVGAQSAHQVLLVRGEPLLIDFTATTPPPSVPPTEQPQEPPVGPLPDYETINGTAGNDILHGGSGKDWIIGGAGHDQLFGRAGEDRLFGGDGNDHLYGYGLDGDPSQDSADTLEGGAGSDYLQGNAGADLLRGGNGSDRISGGADDDTIIGGSGNDSVNGNRGDDLIYGDIGHDTLRGGQGDDDISGGSGHDLLIGDLGNDTLSGGPGIDTLTGGGGADQFVFLPGEGATGTDTITDFRSGQDKLLVYGTDNLLLSNVTTDMTNHQTLSDAMASVNSRMRGEPGEHEIFATRVAGEVYLLAAETEEQIGTVIRLQGVTDVRLITSNDFVDLAEGEPEPTEPTNPGPAEPRDIIGSDGGDVLSASAGLDTMTGGAGEDLFIFLTGEGVYTLFGSFDQINDFTDGEDQILLANRIGSGPGDILQAPAGVTFFSEGAARAYAQILLDQHLGRRDVAVLEVGSDSYLFYNDSNGDTINSVIRLVGVDASTIGTADFLAAA